MNVVSARKSSSKNKKLGRNLARLRVAAGLTQEQLAEAAGISTRYVQDLEAGLYTPTIFIVNELKKALKVEWDELLHGLD